MNFIQHYKTVSQHRSIVRKHCFQVGLYWQGLVHDFSKYSPVEFLVGARYFQGDRSPNNAEREAKGYSASWLHHKGRNKHHFEYWIDYNMDRTTLLCGMKMPQRYVIEMFIDRIAACKTYQKEAYTDKSPWEYHQKSRRVCEIMHEDTQRELEFLLKMLADKGEDETFKYAGKIVRKDRINRFKHFLSNLRRRERLN